MWVWGVGGGREMHRSDTMVRPNDENTVSEGLKTQKSRSKGEIKNVFKHQFNDYHVVQQVLFFLRTVMHTLHAVKAFDIVRAHICLLPVTK